MSRLQELEQLMQSSDTDSAKALAFYDSLETVDTAFMIGRWKGKGCHTGHRMDGLLEAFNWHGKVFEDEENVHPLVFRRSNGDKVRLNPIWFPMQFARRSALTEHRWTHTLFDLFTWFLWTNRSRARLRMTEYRGKVTATMVYDQKPINDVFRKVDDNTVLGAMDLKGDARPFMFVLERDH